MSTNKDREEVNLIDYLKVILGHKKTIIVIFSGIVLGVLVFSLWQPKTYRAEVLLEIGRLRDPLIQNYQFIVLTEGASIRDILILTEKAVVAFLKNHPDFKEIGEGFKLQMTNEGYLLIAAETSSAKASLDTVQRATDILLEEHQRIFGQYSLVLEEREAQLKKDLETTEKEIALIRQTINQFQSARTQSYAIALQAYLGRLSGLENKKDNLDKSLASTKEIRSTSRMTQVKSEPRIFATRPREDLWKKIVIAAAAGLIIGTFGAFIQNWWQKNKGKLKIENCLPRWKP